MAHSTSRPAPREAYRGRDPPPRAVPRRRLRTTGSARRWRPVPAWRLALAAGRGIAAPALQREKGEKSE